MAPEKLGYGINWPIGYDDVAPWYSHVEQFIGVCGAADGLDAMPDGEFLPPFDFNCAELHLRDALRAKYRDRHRGAGSLGASLEAEADSPAAGPRHLPGAQSLHARLPVRRLLQLHVIDAARGRRRPAT